MRSTTTAHRSRLLVWLSIPLVTISVWNLYLGRILTRKFRLDDPTSFMLDRTFPTKQSQSSSRGNNVIESSGTNHKHASQTEDTGERLNLVDRLGQRPVLREPTHEACSGGYDGIYHIKMGDIGGAAGTVFFQFVIGQILYAERNNLKPWIHLSNISAVVYDNVVHGQEGSSARLRAMVGRNATRISRPRGHIKDVQPGPPDPTVSVKLEELHFHGTGVWEHYFEPISDFVPGDRSCESKLYVTMDLYLITPGIHGFSEWAPRCWRYKYLPDYITKPHIPLAEWLEPQRLNAHSVINRYIRFRSELVDAAEYVNPRCSIQDSCLGLHIRHSDKAAGRRVVETSEFLPFASAFVHAGGKNIFLATDSRNVVDEIEEKWPDHVKNIIRTMGDDVVRSHDDTAVFDIAAHHRTNVEVLVDILALSKCQYLVHGLSAVSESSIWINFDLHLRSVNLEDPDHLSAAAFGTMVQMELREESERFFPRPIRTDRWWDDPRYQVATIQTSTNEACHGYDGVLRIGSVAKDAGTGRAFFTSVLNQLIYADMYNLKPWVHLRDTAEFVYDSSVHSKQKAHENFHFEMMKGASVPAVTDSTDARLFYPGEPISSSIVTSFARYEVLGNGVWESYFEPVSDFIPGDSSCREKPLIELDQRLVDPGIEQYANWSVKAWRYDDVPERLWQSPLDTLHDRLFDMRFRANKIVGKYYKLKDYIIARADVVNPVLHSDYCLGVHIRSIDVSGKHRKRINVEKYIEYMEAFRRAGGKQIFVATDSWSTLNYLQHKVPSIASMIKTQGNLVARSSKRTMKEWLPHFNEGHHRVNCETLVDILALSKCNYLIHGSSTVPEAAIYWNSILSKNSIHMERPHSSPEEFEDEIRRKLADSHSNYCVNDMNRVLDVKVSTLESATIIQRIGNGRCRKNAVVYLAQKTHSSYDRDSFASFKQSLALMKENYFSVGCNGNNTDLFVFHTGDFNETDLQDMSNFLGSTLPGHIHLVDLSTSIFWARPKHHKEDDPRSWYAWPLFSEGYRRMMHWFAIDIWNFFAGWNSLTGCEYRFIFRLDEDSFIHSPIRYDIFDLMKSHDYVYGYRLCSYEMKVSQRMWTWWSNRHPEFVPYRKLDLNMCGFYNNFFVADLEFFQNPNVSAFLRFIDRQGQIYRRRLGDLMIHSMAVYAFAPAYRIHRFLDFTYEHGTVDKANGCLTWGGIQAGYDDTQSSLTVDSFYQRFALERGCQLNASFLGANDLSPSYSHLSPKERSRLSLHTVVAGAVELPAGKGILSG